MISDCFTKFGMIEHKMRALRAADEMGREAEASIGKINPRAGSINYQTRFNLVNGIRQLVAEKKRIMVSACENSHSSPRAHSGYPPPHPE